MIWVFTLSNQVFLSARGRWLVAELLLEMAALDVGLAPRAVENLF